MKKHFTQIMQHLIRKLLIPVIFSQMLHQQDCTGHSPQDR